MTRSERTLGYALVGPAALILWGCGSTEPPSTGVAEQEIVGGTIDSADSFPEVVALVQQGGTSSQCTGVLITPRWVMSAGHCFDGSPFSTTGNVDIKLGVDPANSDPDRRRSHTMTSGTVATRSFGSSGLDTDDISAFRLNAPVPRHIARPRHPPLIANTCPSSGFTGQLVGYGRANYELDEAEVCGPEDNNLRRFSSATGWDREGGGGESRYEKVWTLLFDPCVYNGNSSGDSGGALLDMSGNLCGIITEHFVFPLGIGWTVTASESGADSTNTIAFLETAQGIGQTSQGVGIIDAKGNFDGECPEYVWACDNYSSLYCEQIENQDVDGDDIIDICDDCVSIWNHGQISTGDDPDQNGYGASCDLCAGMAFDAGAASDCNHEASTAKSWPTLAAPPVMSGPPQTTQQQTQLQQDINKYLTNFKPNVCDPVGCPKQGRSTGGLALDPIVDCSTAWEPNCNCGIAILGGTCEWQVSPNRIRMSPRTNPTYGEALSTPVKVGLRWCECDEFDLTGNPAGRKDCRDDCPMTGQAYDSLSAWKPVATSTSPGGTYTTGAEFSAQLEHFNDTGWQLSRYWDFRPLAEMGYGEVVHILDDPERPIVKWKVHGILMSKIPEVNSQRVSPTVKPHYYELAMTFQSGSAVAEIVTHEPQFNIPEEHDWLTAIVCPWCPEDFALIGKVLENPPVMATTEGVQEFEGASDSLAQVFDDAVSGAVQYVPASEQLAWLSGKTAPGAATLRAVTLDSARASIVHVLESSDIHDAPSVDTRDEASGGPELFGNEGVVLSGYLRSLLVVGGTEGGEPGGTARGSAWLLQVDSQEWVELEIEGSLPADMLGASFRPQDYRIYLAARKEGNDYYLWNYLPGAETRLLAELPGFWSGFPTTWLVVGDGGEIVFAGSSEEESLVAAFKMSAAGELSFVGALRSMMPITARPIVTRSTIFTIVPTELERLYGIPFDDLEEPPPEEMPIIL